MAILQDSAVVDLEAIIRDFASDIGRGSLQLPRLTTGQRREAKRLLSEHHSGLRCENIGCGAERRLVLVKEGAERAPEEKPVFSLEAAIDDFAKDPERCTYELPALTTGQRREAKRIAERYPELRCESFGLAAERRLHLFKQSEPAQKVDPTIVIAALPLPAPCPETPGPGGNSPHGGSDTSTCASGGGAVERTPLPEGLRVRNTFICSVEDPEAVADSRIVQSMPAGMFGRRLLEELAHAQGKLVRGRPPALDERVAVAAAPEEDEEAAEPLPPSPVAWPMVLAPGVEAEIYGLTKAPAFNGARGTVCTFDEETGRYDVLLVGPGQQWAKIRAENLRVLEPCQSA